MDSLTKWLRYSILTGIFAVPFIPFLISASMFFPFITLKNFAFRIIVELIAGLYVILALKDPSLRPRSSLVLWAVGAFVLSAGIATLLSVDVLKSFWSNFERMEGFIGVLHLAVYFVVAGAVLSTEKLWERFIQTSIGASVIMGGYGALQLLGFLVINQGGVRVDGTFGNAIYLAAYMLFHIFLTLWLFVRHQGALWVRILYVAVMALQFTMLFFSGTRGALLGLVIGLFVAAGLVAWRERERKDLRKAAFALIGLMLLSGGALLAARNIPAIAQHPVLGRFATVSIGERTVQARFMVWNIALHGVVDKPVFGWGQENFNYVFNKYYDPAMYNQEQWFDRAHNSFIDWLVAGGFVTFLLYVSLFVLLALAFVRARTKLSFAERAILCGLIVAYAVHACFVFDNLLSSIYFFTLLAFAHMLSRNDLPANPKYLRPVSQNVLVPTAVVVALITLGAVYVVNVPGIASAKELLQAISNSGQGLETNLAHFKAVFGRTYLGRQESLEQLLQAAANIAGQQNADPKVRQDFFDLAIAEGKDMMQQRPNDARIELFYGAFLNQFGKYTEALPYLEHASKDSPNKQGILLEIGINTYLNAGKPAEALPYLKKAYDLEPNFAEARILYVIALLYSGQKTQADQVLMQGYGTVVVDDSRILKTYFDLKMFDRVVEIWKVRVAANPTDLQTRVSLAAGYLAAGNRPAAVQVLRDAIAIDPSFKETGEKFISDIQAGRNP